MFTVALGFAIALAVAMLVNNYQSRPAGTGDLDDNAIAPPELSLTKPPITVPVADLHSALTELCDSDDQESDDDLSPEEKQARIDEFNELPQKVVDRLSVSPSAEHLHLAATLEKNAATRIELLERAIALNPNDAFLLWDAVQICASARDANACRRQDWEQRLLAIDGQNSESWIQVAANRYAAGETEAALDAMRYASTAAVSWSYWTEMIEMIEAGLAAASELTFFERAGMAFGMASAKPSHHNDYLTMCREQSANNAEWAYTCLAYGELVENQGKTQMDTTIALGFQRVALEALDDEAGATAVMRRGQAAQEQRTALVTSPGNNHTKAIRLVFSKPEFFSDYLATIREHGEAVAIGAWMKEATRLLQEHPELVCKP